jgi:hypothetical protein
LAAAEKNPEISPPNEKLELAIKKTTASSPVTTV